MQENVRDVGSFLMSGRSPGEENGNPLQYFCLENPVDRGAWRATWGSQSQTQLSDSAHTPAGFPSVFHLCCFFPPKPLYHISLHFKKGDHIYQII